jgi:hypothetical protein
MVLLDTDVLIDVSRKFNYRDHVVKDAKPARERRPSAQPGKRH